MYQNVFNQTFTACQRSSITFKWASRRFEMAAEAKGAKPKERQELPGSEMCILAQIEGDVSAMDRQILHT